MAFSPSKRDSEVSSTHKIRPSAAHRAIFICSEIILLIKVITPIQRERSMNGTLTEDIAVRLRSLITEAAPGPLPSIATLCTLCGASRPVVAKALKRLASEGIVEIHQGRAPVKPPADFASRLPQTTTAAQRARRLIEQRIESGVYRAGDPLPKLGYLASTEGFSRTTITEAVRMLAVAGALTKRGRAWIVGGGRQHRASVSPLTWPCILLLQLSPRAWDGLFCERTIEFPRAFSQEARRLKVRLILASCEKYPFGYTLSPRSEVQSLSQLVKTLGDIRYRGALVLGGRESPVLDEICTVLAGFRRPIAILDTSTWPAFTGPAPPGVTRCLYNEACFSQTGIDHLLSMGHSTLGFVGGYTSRESWTIQRMETIAKRLSEKAPSGKLWDYQNAWKTLANRSEQALADHLHRLLHEGPVRARKTIRGTIDLMHQTAGGIDHRRRPCRNLAILIQRTGAMTTGCGSGELRIALLLLRFLIIEKLTALISVRDAHVRTLLPMISRMKISIPRELSIVSYDNYIDDARLPVDSVDNGFGDLGYRAFHRIIGDIPIAVDRSGNLVTHNDIAVRGSVCEAK